MKTAVLKCVVLTCLGVSSLSAWAGNYYVCLDAHGGKLFTQDTCPPGYTLQQQRSYDTQTQGVRLNANDPSASDRNISDANEHLQELERNNRKLKLQRELRENTYKLDTLKKDLANRLDSLQQTHDGIAGNNAENRRAAVSEQITSLQQEYQSKISQLSAQITTQQKELDSLAE
ncbi:hypothetical protein [Oceanobacter mangrovi]|uniref:hypothetical protein n=1 Tax=Oceanobacter mangrovi TaxID=2862510 RepID=UPI001C8EF0E7|nr:hypothetical protein [Oceanobacter mangrovi]